MANEIQITNESSAPNLIGSSRGVTPDTSGADLFKGVTDAAEMIVKGVNQFFDNSMKDEARSSVDAVQKKYGSQPQVDAEVNKTIMSDPSVPLEIKNRASQAAKINASYANGQLSESRYWAELDNVSRQLRSRYPGYRDEIDNYMSSLTGAIPANRLIQAVRHEQAKKDTDQSHYDSLVQKMTFDEKVGGLPRDFFTRKNAGNPYNMDELLSYTSEKTAMWYNDAVTKAKYESNKREQTLTDDQSFRLANSIFSRVRTDGLDSVTGGPSGTQEFQNKLNNITTKLQNGVLPSSTELEQLRMGYSAYRTNSDLLFDKMMTTRASGSSKSWGDVLSPEHKKQLREDHNAFFDQLQKDITNGDVGALSVRIKAMENSKNDLQMQVYSDATLRGLKLANEAGGPNVAANILGSVGSSSMANVRNSIEKANAESQFWLSIGQSAQDYKSGKSVSQYDLSKGVDSLRKENVKDPNAYSGNVQAHLNVLNNSSISPDLRKGAAFAMYGPNNLGFVFGERFKPDTQDQIFRMMVNPTTYKSIQEMNDPRLTTMYSKWSNDTLVGLSSSLTGSFGPNDVISRNVDIQFDPKSFTFTTSIKPYVRNPNDPMMTQGRYIAESEARQRRAEDILPQLKTKMLAIKPVWEAGGDIAKSAQDFFSAAGIPIQVQTPEKTSSGKNNDRIIGTQGVSNLKGGSGADDIADAFSQDFDPTQSRIGGLANVADKMSRRIWDESLIDSLMTKAERKDPEELAAIRYEFSDDSPVYGMYSLRLEDKLRKETAKLDKKDVHTWTNSDINKYEEFHAILIKLSQKNQDYWEAVRTGNHQAIQRREPTWFATNSPMEQMQEQYIKDNNIPKGETIDKKMRDIQKRKEELAKE